MNCKDCKFYTHDGHYGSCKRYPKVEVKSGGDWCGEFQENTTKIIARAYGEIEFIPAITVDEVGEMMKPKRGRPAKEQK